MLTSAEQYQNYQGNATEAPHGSAPSDVGNSVVEQSVQSSQVETSSGTSLGIIIFLLLWAMAIIFLSAMVFFGWYGSKSRSINEDIEAPGLKRKSKDRPTRSSRPLFLGLTAISGIIAFVLSILANTSCSFVTVSDDLVEYDSIGMWKAAPKDADGGICVSTHHNPDFFVDTPLWVARIAGMLASFLGTICFLLLVRVLMASRNKEASEDHDGSSTVGGCLFPLLFCVAVIQAVTIRFLATDQCNEAAGCYLDMGAFSSITATCYWILCALGLYLMPVQ